MARHAKTHETATATLATPASNSLSSAVETTTQYSAEQHDSGLEFDAYGLLTPAAPAASEPDAFSQPTMDHGEYHWPDSEDLFALLSSEPANWALDAQIALPYPPSGESYVPEHEGETSSNPDTAQARQAIRHVDNMIQDLSFSLTSELAALGATSDFLNTCMSCFWSRLVPIFPILHQPTFLLKDYSPPTLLNMIALGSLFLVEKGARAKGEVLWRLAHHAVATSWQSMLNTGSEVDAMKGMRLVMTALLGQCYAVMSGNRSIRLIGHVFHGLGFYWAHQCGLDHQSRPPAVVSIDPERITESWHQWACHEVRNRALIGHYILDGLITQSSGLPSSTRHTVNNLILPCDDAEFDADSAVLWLNAMHRKTGQPSSTFRELLLDLFEDGKLYRTVPLSHMTVPVLLEAVQSLISESSYAQGPAVGLPSKQAIGQALWRLWNTQITHPERPRPDVNDLTIRWHVVCINFCVQPGVLLQQLCHRHGIQQDLFTKPLDPSQKGSDPLIWCSSHWARRALLHAVAVVDLIQHLSLGKAHALHLPLALNTAATIMACFALSGRSIVRIPEREDWAAVCNFDEDDGVDGTLDDGVRTFVTTGKLSTSTPCSLSLYMNSAQSMLASLFCHWAVAQEMSQVLGQLVAQRT